MTAMLFLDTVMEVKGRDLSSNSDRECNLRAIMNKNGNLKWVQAHKKENITSIHPEADGAEPHLHIFH